MSNWSVVIVGWSGVEDSTSPHRQRWDSLLARYAEITLGERLDWCIHPPCPDTGAIGKACEFLAVGHENAFAPGELLKAMSEQHWESPLEAVVLWKDEDMDRYRQFSVQAHREYVDRLQVGDYPAAEARLLAEDAGDYETDDNGGENR